MDMSITSASRLRWLPKYNTFIGNIGDEFPDATTFLTACSSFNNIEASDFQNYEVDTNNNIRFFIEKDYKLGTNKINNRNIKYYVDLDGYLVDAQTNMQRQNNSSFFYIPNDNPDNYSYRGNTNSIIVLPNATNIGTSTGNNDVFSIGTNGLLVTNKILETNNGGSPDGDVQQFISNGGSVTYKDLADPTQNTSPTAPTISANTIGGTYVELNVSQPTHVNNLKYALVFVDGFFQDVYDINNVYATKLQEQTSYDIKVIIADEYFNISPYSNTINVTTTTTPALYQNAVAYYKLDETSGDAIDVVNGFNGTLFGGVTQGVAGKIGTAYSFDGVDGFLESSLDMSIYTSFTVRAWFKTSDTGNNCLFSTGQPNGISSRFDIVIESGVLFIRLDGGNISYTSFSLNDNNWHRVVIIVPTNSNTLDFRAFVDRVELSIAQNTNNNSLNIQSGLTRFGKTTRNDGFFNGEIDEICIDQNYNLTLGEISDDYNNGLGTTI